MKKYHRVMLVLTAVPMVFAAGLPAVGATSIYEGDANSESFTMDDYHITIEADGPITGVSGVLSDDGFFPAPTINGEGTNQVTLDWFVLDVPPGDAIGFCISFSESSGSYKIKKNFTAVKSYDVPALGASVSPTGDYALNNDYDFPIFYSNLQYVVQPTGYPGTDEGKAEMMEAVASGVPFDPGWIPLPDGVVGPLSETGTLADVDVAEGEFLLAFFHAEFEGGPAGISFTIQEHEHQGIPAVPAVSGRVSILLGGLMLVALTIALLRLRRQPSP